MTVPPFEADLRQGPSGPKPPVVTTAPAADTGSVPGVKRCCAIAPSGTGACWELADPAMTGIPDYFLDQGLGRATMTSRSCSRKPMAVASMT